MLRSVKTSFVKDEITTLMDRTAGLRYKMCHLSPCETTAPVPFPGLVENSISVQKSVRKDRGPRGPSPEKEQQRGGSPCQAVNIKIIWQRNKESGKNLRIITRV